MIYGREKARYSVTYEDVSNATIPNTFKWIIADEFLDGTDNTTILTTQAQTQTQEKVYESRGEKDVTIEFQFDDGWGNIYNHSYTKTFTAIPYEEPELSWLYGLQDIHINEEVSLEPIYNDSRVKGEIVSNIDFDFGDSTYKTIAKTEKVYHAYTTKQDYTITADFKYWDGWEQQEVSVSDNISIANTPPVSGYNFDDSGICVTKRIWKDSSLDLDGIADIVYRRFDLKQETTTDSGTFATISSKELSSKDDVFEFQFATEGKYQIAYTIRDVDFGEDTKTEDFDIIFKVCDGSTDNPGKINGLKGSIILQQGWQLICIPTIMGHWSGGVLVKDTTISNVKNYIIDQLCQKLSITETELMTKVQVLNAFRGGNDAQNYVVGLTSVNSINNFNLSYVDGTSTEFTSFWIKVLDNNLPNIDWEYYDGN